ncbi:MAG: hypothetical protein WC635_06705 [Bacteriovorax sp.]|jgi:hypothetical protein
MKFKLSIIAFLINLQLLSCSHGQRSRFYESKKIVEDFQTAQEAEEFFLSKRLEYVRIYELGAEPYFGTPLQQVCDNNIDIKADVKTIGKNKFFYLRMLANKFDVIGDCLKENNHHFVIYEFELCGNKVINKRYSFLFDHFQYTAPDIICTNF